MFAIKFSMEKQIKKFCVAGFFLPAINTTVFSISPIYVRKDLNLVGQYLEVASIVSAGFHAPRVPRPPKF